jgi:mRNA interferase RelE/StbE
MPAKQFHILKNAQKKSQRLPERVRSRLSHIFFTIKQNPLVGVKLHGELEGYYKYRLGDYRIAYIFDSKTSTVEIQTIEHRQGVYK